MKTKNKNVKEVLVEMLTENTGKALCDSGDYYGRHWEKNQRKTLADFEAQPEVRVDKYGWSISLFHYLKRGLELDEVCDEFNSKYVPAKDWESDIYGVSEEGHTWIEENGFRVLTSFNSYNGDSALDQVIQGTWLERGDVQYLLLQIHGGCDIRGGYTDARLFVVPKYYDGPLQEYVYGQVIKPDGTEIRVDNRYDGVNLHDENNHKVEVDFEKDKVELYLSDY